MQGGSFQLGFELQPLDISGQLPWLPTNESFDENTTWKKAQKNKIEGNKSFKEGLVQEAVARYSELIMQARALEKSDDPPVPEDRAKDVRLLIAQAYLNLAACFLKIGELGHAQNTATRALQGDEDPPNPAHNVLEPAARAKALFRRAQARQALQNYDLARQDYEASLQLTDDKAVRQALAELRGLEKEATKAEKKQFSGMFSKGDAFGPTPAPAVAPPEPTETVKISEGLFLAPSTNAVEAAGKAAEEGALSTEGLEEEATALRDRVERAAKHQGMSSEEFIAGLKDDAMRADMFARGELDPPPST